MARPEVSVVMPFAGDAAGAGEAVLTLRSLSTEPGDELILVDNSQIVAPVDGVRVLPAAGERSPAHARNVGAAVARGEWILFLDADCRVPVDLLDAYFEQPVQDDVGALAGEVVGAAAGSSLAERYGAARNFLSQQVHLAHPYLPRAVAANLMVRRRAFEELGGFYEGLRAAEDTDFSWRLQRAGWRLASRAPARVEHRYRASLRDLRRQWRGYAAGRAWLGRRYEGFKPQPAVRRAMRTRNPSASAAARELRAPRSYRALDALLAVEELAGLVLSNRPASSEVTAPARVVLVADRFPAAGDPRSEFVRALQGARVEAGARPQVIDAAASRDVAVSYREDDGLATRAMALVSLLLRHPLRSALDVARNRGREPSLIALAPAARRLRHDPDAQLRTLGAGSADDVAQRLAALMSHPLDS